MFSFMFAAFWRNKVEYIHKATTVSRDRADQEHASVLRWHFVLVVATDDKSHDLTGDGCPFTENASNGFQRLR